MRGEQRMSEREEQLPVLVVVITYLHLQQSKDNTTSTICDRILKQLALYQY